MYLSQASAIKNLPKWSQVKAVDEGSKWFGRWETVCRCDQSWAPGSKSPNIETWQNSHQPGTVTLKHNLIFDACCKLLSFIQHKAPGCNFSLSIAIFQRETPLFMTHPLCGGSVPVTQILISTLDTSIVLRYWPRPRIIPPEALCRVLAGISCQLESDSVHWVKEGGKKVRIYNTSIKMTPRGYLRCVLKQSQIWSRDAGVWWVCKHIFPGDQEINQREMCNFRLKLLLILMDPIKQTVGGMECCRDKCNRRFLFYDGLEGIIFPDGDTL